jgi:hypothetical protein
MSLICYPRGSIYIASGEHPISNDRFFTKIDPFLEIRPGRKADLLQQSPERLPHGYLPRNNDPPVLLVLPHILIVEIHEVSDVEGYEAAFFLNGKRKLFAVGFPFSLQILGVNDIKSSLPQRVRQACVDIPHPRTISVSSVAAIVARDAFEPGSSSIRRCPPLPDPN